MITRTPQECAEERLKMLEVAPTVQSRFALIAETTRLGRPLTVKEMNAFREKIKRNEERTSVVLTSTKSTGTVSHGVDG